MSDLTLQEKIKLEKLFRMASGYVMEFSNSTFQQFVASSIQIDIYQSAGYEEYCSKANKLRDIWKKESNYKAGKLLHDLISKYEDDLLEYKNKAKKDGGNLNEYERKMISDCKAIAERLLSDKQSMELPQPQEETLQTLIQDINMSLQSDKPELVLDRLHTFATKFLRAICEKNGILIVNEKGIKVPLQSLIAMLKNYYEKNNVIQSDFSIVAVQNNIQIFDRYNYIRNEISYAHDNEILNKIEARFAVKTIANTLIFIDELEKFRDGNLNV